MTGTDSPGRKDLVLFLYVCAFVILDAALYSLRDGASFIHGAAEIFAVFLFPFGAFVYGYATGDRVQSFLAGALSYASFLAAAFATGIQHMFEDPNYPVLFAGYHLTLLIVAGLIGCFASNRRMLFRVLALVLAVLWVMIFARGIELRDRKQSRSPDGEAL